MGDVTYYVELKNRDAFRESGLMEYERQILSHRS